MRARGALRAMDMAANCCEAEEYLNTADELRRYRAALSELIAADEEYDAACRAINSIPASAAYLTHNAIYDRFKLASFRRIEALDEIKKD